MSKQVAKKQEAGALVDVNILLEDIGAGMEGMSPDDMMIPRLSILQQMSPQVNKRDGAYVEGAEPGFVLDNVAGKAIDGEQGITVVPISYRRSHIEWKADRGGMVQNHGADSSCLDGCTRGDRGQYLTSEGNEIAPTAEYVVYVVSEDGSFSPAALSMSKSQLKKARLWNSMMHRLQVPHPTDKEKKINPAMFWNAYKLTTVPQENDQGSWFSWKIEMMFDASSGGIIEQLPNGTGIYLSAREFKDQVSSGEVKVSPESSDEKDAPF